MGGLDAVTSEQTARYFNSPTDNGRSPIEPLTNYFVGRLRRDLNNGNSFIGGMVTGTNRSLSDNSLAAQLRRGSYLAGLDFEHSWAKRSWIMTGFAAGSRVEGSPAAIALTQRSSSRYFQRPDADYVHFDSTRTSLEGHQASSRSITPATRSSDRSPPRRRALASRSTTSDSRARLTTRCCRG